MSSLGGDAMSGYTWWLVVLDNRTENTPAAIKTGLAAFCQHNTKLFSPWFTKIFIFAIKYLGFTDPEQCEPSGAIARII